MNEQQARIFMISRDTYCTSLARKPKHELARMYDEISLLKIGKKCTKDELIGSLLEMRYPNEKRNEAIHVIAHTDIWPDCQFCKVRSIGSQV